MTEVAILADLHVGNIARFGGHTTGGVNVRCARTIDAFRAALKRVAESGCKSVIVAGDIHDSDRPSPPVVAAMMRVFDEFKDLFFYLMVGNHDQRSEELFDNALAPYDHLKNVLAVQSPSYTVFGIFAVPYHPSQAHGVIAYLDAVLPVSAEPYDAVGHFGIAHVDTPLYLAKTQNCVRYDDLAALCQRKNIRRMFCGDWHTPWEGKFFGKQLVQIGSLAPVNFSDGKDAGTGGIIAKAAGWDRFSVPGPRFLTVADQRDLAAAVAAQTDMSQGYVCVVCPGDPGLALADACRAQWPKATVVTEPRAAAGAEEYITADLAADWSPDALESHVLAWVESTVPEDRKPAVAEAIMACLRRSV